MKAPVGQQDFRLHPDHVLQDRRLITRSLAALYLSAPVLGLAWLEIARAPATSELGMLVVIALALAGGGLLLTGVFERSPRWTLQAAMAGATLLASAAVYFSGVLHSGFAFMYLWSAPYAFCFFTRRQAAIQMTLLGGCYAAALALQGGHAADVIALNWVLVFGTVLIVGLLVRRLTESLRESDVRFQLGFEASHIGLALITPDGRWMRVNPALCEFLGRPADELVGAPVADFVHP
ncbi:MAG: hypothetical protein QOD76_1331, partial [Solirubrobacteraceae bacterium]|nr:hypothetical protein [Solirubrobacteraceae bacterium]